MAKISNIMIGVLIIGLFIVGIGGMMSSFSSSYGVSYDNSTIQSFNKIQNIENTSVAIKDKAYGQNKTFIQSTADIVGSYFSSAYDVLVLTKDSLSSVDSMKDKAIEQSNLGSFSYYLKISFGAVIFIIFTFVLIRALTKEDL